VKEGVPFGQAVTLPDHRGFSERRAIDAERWLASLGIHG
jgi:hypothetical protein